jgi:hypothetical protein
MNITKKLRESIKDLYDELLTSTDDEFISSFAGTLVGLGAAVSKEAVESCKEVCLAVIQSHINERQSFDALNGFQPLIDFIRELNVSKVNR